MFQAFHLSETMEQPVQQPKQGTKTDASPPIPVLQLYQLGTKKKKRKKLLKTPRPLKVK